MAKLVWDAEGSRKYEAGLDKVVLYTDTAAVPWNGFTQIEEKQESGAATIYYDGVKRWDVDLNSDFQGSMSVFTYPDEFLPYDGVQHVKNGIFVDGQPLKQFGLSYRTRVSNDLDADGGYLIHLLYNLTAVSADRSYGSINESADILDFTWELRGVPEFVTNFRPTAHVIVDTTRMQKYLLSEFTDIIYGTPTKAARLPRVEELSQFMQNWELITVTEGPNDTFTISGPDEYIRWIAPDIWEVDHIDAYFYGQFPGDDPAMYEIRSTGSWADQT